MIILDTDILSLVQRDDSPEGMRIRARIAELPRDELVGTTILSYHEQTGGWLAYISKARTKAQQVYAYGMLERHLEDFRKARIVSYDRGVADLFEGLRERHPRLGTMDLRIAAIALCHDALLVSRNVGDFGKIPGLRVEDWSKG